MPSRHSSVEKLSERQKEILRLFGQNMQAKEIARELEISLTTVRTHMDEARRRLGVSNSREAARLLIAYERELALLAQRGPHPQRMVKPGSFAPDLSSEQDNLQGRVDSTGSQFAAETDAEEIEILLAPASAGGSSQSSSAFPAVRLAKSGLRYGNRKRLVDRGWAVFERRLESLKLWQWFGFAILIAVSMTVAGSALIQGSLVMFKALHEIQR